MSAAFATAEPAPSPDPDRAGKPAYGARRFAGFLRSVIDCGKHLALAVRLRAQKPDFPRFTKPFGTNCLQEILHRIGIAVRRAVLLEADKLRELGLLSPRRVRTPSAGTTRAARQSDAPCAPTQPKKRTAPAARRSSDPRNAGIPTVRQLAADICRRSVAAVLADICRGLGITPRHALWPDVRAAIAACGGSVEELENDAGERWCSTRWLAIPFVAPPVCELVFWPAPWSDPVTAAAATATGPP